MPCLLIADPAQLPILAAALETATRVAIDTETPIDGPMAGQLRVMSVATRDPDGIDTSFVVDARDVDPTLLAPLLDGVEADAWNANFDAHVLDVAVWKTSDTTSGLRWWDAQLGDALLHQGRSGVTWFHGLAWATEHYLGIEAEGKGTVQISFTADDDLSPEQIRYSANDAVETLWVGDEIRRALSAAGLDEVAAIEMQARPFLDQMERTGLPFDWEGWRKELDVIEANQRTVLGTIAAMTGGGQGSLFDDIIEPTWNPASDQQTKHVLNQFAEPRVLAWCAERKGAARLLGATDSVNATVLTEIGGPLCEALLAFRSHTKVLSTYGESIREHVADDGRLHPQYLQVVGTNTGRLASRNPNAQNFTPRMLPFVRPPDPDRVFVHADLSQAELRVLAQVGDDAALRAAFAAGVDVHVSTAASMFGVDPVALERDDPDRLAHLRKVAKALNFGIAYGSGAAALSRSLTAEGSPTTVEEATELLRQYRATYPGTAAWAETRIAEIRSLSNATTAIDWRATMRLARGWSTVSSIRRDHRRNERRWPTIDEVVDRHPEVATADRAELTSRVAWLASYSAPVALLHGGEPFTFASRTVAGRRQQFNLHLDRLFLRCIVDALRATEDPLVRLRAQFADRHGLDLGSAAAPLTSSEVERCFEDRSLRLAYIEAIAAAIGTSATDARLVAAASERVEVMVNAWRNAPIQGTVADIMLVAYADLDQRLRRFEAARPVQTVHDSIVVECRKADAAVIAVEVREAMELASRRFCPDVEPKADVDIRASLSDDDSRPVLG